MEEQQSYRIVTRIDRPAKDQFCALHKTTTGNVCDAMGRLGAMDFTIKPLDSRMKCIGTAVTVITRPCDNLLVYKALDLARPGDVIVVGTHGYTGSSVWGDITSSIAQQKKLAGMVTDGLVRDTQGILETGFPVFARGTTPNSPFKDGPGQINVPITCGGIRVDPGDVVVCDADGVVVIPQNIIAEVVSRALEIAAEDARKTDAVRAGNLIPQWVDQKLKKKGYSWQPYPE